VAEWDNQKRLAERTVTDLQADCSRRHLIFTRFDGSPSSPVQKTHQQHVREICSALEAHSEREPGPHKLILLFQRIGKSNRWTSYLMDLRGQNNNLPALKDEMAKAGL